MPSLLTVILKGCASTLVPFVAFHRLVPQAHAYFRDRRRWPKLYPLNPTRHAVGCPYVLFLPARSLACLLYHRLHYAFTAD